MKFKYEQPKSQSGNKKTPVTLYTKNGSGFYPDKSEIDKTFFCMAEMYESSLKDHDVIKDIESAEYTATLIIPDPFTDFKVTNDAYFKVETFRYEGLEFNIQSVAPYEGVDIKIVGAVYVS